MAVQAEGSMLVKLSMMFPALASWMNVRKAVMKTMPTSAQAAYKSVFTLLWL